MSATKLLAALASKSLQISTTKSMVRLDHADNPVVEQTYLTIEGTADALRWLSAQLAQMANSVEKHNSRLSVIVSPRDLSQVVMTDWDSLELTCTTDQSND